MMHWTVVYSINHSIDQSDNQWDFHREEYREYSFDCWRGVYVDRLNESTWSPKGSKTTETDWGITQSSSGLQHFHQFLDVFDADAWLRNDESIDTENEE